MASGRPQEEGWCVWTGGGCGAAARTALPTTHQGRAWEGRGYGEGNPVRWSGVLQPWAKG